MTFHDCIGGFGMGPSDFMPGSAVEINAEEKYALALAVIHAPSEHTWAGDHLPLELQLIHQRFDDPRHHGVISIGFQNGGNEWSDHPFLSALLEQDLPEAAFTSSKANTINGHGLNFGELIGDNNTFISYKGSMTIPTCK